VLRYASGMPASGLMSPVHSQRSYIDRYDFHGFEPQAASSDPVRGMAFLGCRSAGAGWWIFRPCLPQRLRLHPAVLFLETKARTRRAQPYLRCALGNRVFMSAERSLLRVLSNIVEPVSRRLAELSRARLGGQPGNASSPWYGRQ